MDKSLKYFIEVLALRAESVKKQISFIDDLNNNDSIDLKARNALISLDEKLSEYALFCRADIPESKILINEINQLYSQYHKYYFKDDINVKLKDRVLSKYRYIIQKYA